jgi:hypothetical protein
MVRLLAMFALVAGLVLAADGERTVKNLQLDDERQRQYMRHFFSDPEPSNLKFMFVYDKDLSKADFAKATRMLDVLADKYTDVLFHTGLTAEGNGRLLTSFGIPHGRLPAMVIHNVRTKQTHHLLEDRDTLIDLFRQGDPTPFERFIRGCSAGTWPTVSREYVKLSLCVCVCVCVYVCVFVCVCVCVLGLIPTLQYRHKNEARGSRKEEL